MHAMPRLFQKSRCFAFLHSFLPAGVVCDALRCEALAGLLQALADESVLWHNTAALIQWRIPEQEKCTKSTYSLMQIRISTV
jgi:hypothetical protein